MHCAHRRCATELALLLLGIAAGSLLGQTNSQASGAQPAEAAPVHLPSWLQLRADLRGRWEMPSGIGYANATDSYYLSRLRGNLTIRPVPWLRFFAQVQDSRVGAYPISPAPSSMYNPGDLRQGYVEIGTEGVNSVKARVGRQEITFGGEDSSAPATGEIAAALSMQPASPTRSAESKPISSKARPFWWILRASTATGLAIICGEAISSSKSRSRNRASSRTTCSGASCKSPESMGKSGTQRSAPWEFGGVASYRFAPTTLSSGQGSSVFTPVTASLPWPAPTCWAGR